MSTRGLPRRYGVHRATRATGYHAFLRDPTHELECNAQPVPTKHEDCLVSRLHCKKLPPVGLGHFFELISHSKLKQLNLVTSQCHQRSCFRVRIEDPDLRLWVLSLYQAPHDRSRAHLDDLGLELGECTAKNKLCNLNEKSTSEPAFSVHYFSMTSLPARQLLSKAQLNSLK